MNWRIIDPRRSYLGLVLGYVALGLMLGMAFIVGLLYWVFHSKRDLMVRDGLYGQAEEIAEELVIAADGSVTLDLHEPMRTAYDAFYANLKYRVLEPDGRVLLSSDALAAPLLPDGIAWNAVPAFFHMTFADGEMAVGTYRFVRDGRTIVVQTARSDRFSELAAEAMLPAVFETALVLAVAIALILLLATFLALRVALTRVRQVSTAADAIRPDTLDERLALDGVPLEMVPLVEAFNRALDRLAEGFRMQQRFTANAAHELKTPLAILRSRIELQAAAPLRAQLLADIDAMTRRVQQMLRLSQVQDIRNYRFAPACLRELAQDVLRSFDGYPGAEGKQLVLQGETHAPSRVDAAAIFTALRNLVENALHWSPPGGSVTVTVQPHGYTVLDTGPGFDPAHSALLFERFWRTHTASGDGSGLGLSIVAEVALAHGGQVKAETLATGGSEFSASFGRAQA